MKKMRERYHWENDVTERTMSLRERCHWENDVAERLMSLIERGHWENDITERTISLRERCHCGNGVTERTRSLIERCHWESNVTVRMKLLSDRFRWENGVTEGTLLTEHIQSEYFTILPQHAYVKGSKVFVECVNKVKHLQIEIKYIKYLSRKQNVHNTSKSNMKHICHWSLNE